MQNMTIEQDGDKLVITIDLTAEGRPSKSGKTTTLATTGRPQAVALEGHEDVHVGCNVFRYPPR